MKQTNLLKKTLLLCALIVGSVSSVWADDITIGLTQDYNTATKTNKTWTSLTAEDDHLTLTQQIGSNIMNYSYCDKDPVYLNGTAIAQKGTKNTTDTYNGCWRAATDSYTNQYIGYDLTISSGYMLKINSIYTRALAISDATTTWKVQILNSLDETVYESAEQTLSRTTTPVLNVDVNDLSSNVKDALQSLSGQAKVRFWIKCAPAKSTKYFGLDNLTINAQVVEDTRTTYTITANVADGQSDYGSIDNAGNNEVVEGGSLVLTATANTSYGFVNWTDANGEEVSTNETLTLTNITANTTYTANFKAVYQVTWSSSYRGTYGKPGTLYDTEWGVNEKWADGHDQFTIPYYMHKYYYREGYRFSKWKIEGDDSNARYDSGDEITVTNGTISNNKVTITPVFIASTATLDTSVAPTTVTWTFAKANMIFVDWQSNDKYEYFTETATVNGETIDVPMKITKGKVANYKRVDALAQTNQNTEMTIPAVKGMVVTIADANVAFNSTTIAGSTGYTGSGTTTISYTYTGDDSEITIVIGESNQYLKTIQVVYPAASETVTVATSGWTSLASSLPLDFTNVTKADEGNDDLVAYAVTSITNTSVTLTSVDAALAGEGLILKGTANAEYTISATASAGDITNELEGAVEDTPVEANSVYAVSGGQLKLYTGTTVPAGKAYLPASKVPGEARLSLAFDDEITGITTVESNGMSLFDGDFYDLCGRKVSQPTKGLYIVNGKKVVIK